MTIVLSTAEAECRRGGLWAYDTTFAYSLHSHAVKNQLVFNLLGEAC